MLKCRGIGENRLARMVLLHFVSKFCQQWLECSLSSFRNLRPVCSELTYFCLMTARIYLYLILSSILKFYIRIWYSCLGVQYRFWKNSTHTMWLIIFSSVGFLNGQLSNTVGCRYNVRYGIPYSTANPQQLIESEFVLTLVRPGEPNAAYCEDFCEN